MRPNGCKNKFIMAIIDKCKDCGRCDVKGIMYRKQCITCRFRERYSTDEKFREYTKLQVAKHNAKYAQKWKLYKNTNINRKDYHKQYFSSFGSLRRYGITLDDYNALLKKQGGTCAICKTAPTRKKLFIDHDHKDGRVRGLLCSRCNLLLGYHECAKEMVEEFEQYLAQTNNLTSLVNN